MLEAWRMVKQKYAATAFSGEGAARNGGRWNSRGVSVIYASSTKSLAALESLVHLNPPLLFIYVFIGLKFDNTLVEIIRPQTLPSNWRAEPPPSSTQQMGDAWVLEARSAALAAPSVLITGELNYLLNPAHHDFKKISIGKPERFTFHPRWLV